jgi:RNA polymerase sigma-70 factor (ECF subfamily)
MGGQRRFQFVADRELVEIAQLGSMEACDELVTRFRGAAVLVARQVVGSPELAQDVAQEAFLCAFRALPQLEDPTKFAGWLYAITRNRARRVGMRERRNEPTEDAHLERLVTTRDGHGADPLDAVLRAETEATVRSLLCDLAPEIRIVLQLYYEEQWSTAQIAEFLSLPITTIKWRLHAGRTRLSRRLSALLEENTDA